MKWLLAEHDPGAAARLSALTGIHPLIARFLVIRGITEPAAARSFLSNDLSTLSDPSAFSGMESAVRHIRQAIRSRDRLVIYGDYDVDGVTGSAVLTLALRSLGADVHCYIPDRMTEGYGLNRDALGRLRSAGTSLVITVDCGITAVQEAEAARELGLGLIITDHHEIAAARPAEADGGDVKLPPALAVLHPALISRDLPDAVREGISGLTGVGVAYKLAQALLDAGQDDPRLTGLLDLVTLGTVADMGKLRGENRILVKRGLELLSADQDALRPGLAALKQVSGVAERPVTVGTVGFSLAPRINASGRLERADAAFRLLTTDSPEEALQIAETLDAVNRERQAVEERIWEQVRRECLTYDLPSTGAFVLASADWHPGVIGIVASRIVDEFYRPTALISLKNGTGKGSARSIPGFDLYDGLTHCRDLLLGFGGHKYAAGLSIDSARVPELRERLGTLVRERMGREGFVRTLTIDAPVPLGELTFGLLQDIEQLTPYGQGNPEPRLGAKGLEVLSLRPVGNNRHLKIRLRQEPDVRLDALAFGKAEELMGRIRPGSRVAAVFCPKVNHWNGRTSIELEIKDIKVEP